jgi:hypothetical protein
MIPCANAPNARNLFIVTDWRAHVDNTRWRHILTVSVKLTEIHVLYVELC